MRTFSVEIPVNNPEAMEKFQEMMDSLNDATNECIINLSKELNISLECASDVWYLRTRSRWTEELEQKLIKLYKDGNPPNIFDRF